VRGHGDVISRPQELFSQIQAVSPKLFSSFFEFGLRYCDARQTSFGWDFSGSSHLSELQTFLLATMMIRRVKGDVLPHLPPKRRQHVFIDASKARPLPVSCDFINDDAALLSDHGKRVFLQHGKCHLSNFIAILPCKGSAGSNILQLYRHTGLNKIPGILKYLSNQLKTKPQEKFLVFAHHMEVLNAIEDLLCSKVSAPQTV
jgi:SWI/SNF-related matrix-associated actin-dependent regulator 1 of chromatin subfamily A